MSTPGDQTPSDSSNSKKPHKKPVAGDFDKTLPEGAFDQTLSEDAFDAAPPATSTDKTLPEGAFDRTLPEGQFDDEAPNEDATMIGDEPSLPDDGSTMLSDDGMSEPDEGSTMLSDDGGVPSSEDDFGKTLPDGALAAADSEEEDFAGKTMMMDSEPADEGCVSEDDFGKTMPAGALLESADDQDDTDKTMVSFEPASTSADSADDFGKTIQVDAFSATMTDDGDTFPQEDFDGKTIVGSDSAVEQNLAPPKPKPKPKDLIPLGRTIAGPNAKQSADGMFTSQATRAGGLTSVQGTEVGAANVDGIEKDDLNVAVRQITGLSYGRIPLADFKLVKVLGEGGMGVVYVAKQQSLGREVVFKTLKPMPDAQASKLKASGTFNSVIKHRSDMFLSEAVVTADLFHPNIVPIYELAEAPDGSLFSR